jgi:hypothetical protein
MPHAPISSAIVAAVVLLGASGAWAQTTPQKTKSPAEVEQAIDAYNAKIMNCRSQARAQKLHFMKRRRFIRECVNSP